MKFPYKIIDLTHQLEENVPSWDNSCGFNHTITSDYDDCTTGVKFRINKFKMYSGVGTHIDSPAHCFQNKKTIEQVPLSDLISPLVIIDVSDRSNQNYTAGVDEIKTFEKQYGQIAECSFVILYTGWCKHWLDRNRYHNNHCFPSVGLDAANLLLERNIIGLGIDTLSPDRPDSGFCVHQAILGSDKYIIENINISNYDSIPKLGAFVGAFPLKIKNGTEAPLRLVAFIPNNSN